MNYDADQALIEHLSNFYNFVYLSCCLGWENIVDNELAKYCKMIAPLVQLFDLDVIVLQMPQEIWEGYDIHFSHI